MDQHLNFIVDRTEKISALLTESMNVENASSRRTTPNVSDAEMEENDEYEPNEDSDDDERTIGKKNNLIHFCIIFPPLMLKEKRTDKKH